MPSADLKVKCPNCKRVLFVTTDQYDPDVTAHGGMVKSLAPYPIDFLCVRTTGVAEMTCPECLAPLAPKGRLHVLPSPPEIAPYQMEGANVEIPDGEIAGEPWGKGVEVGATKIPAPPDMPVGSIVGAEKFDPPIPCTTEPAKHICEICGKQVKTAMALKGHMRSHEKKGSE